MPTLPFILLNVTVLVFNPEPVTETSAVNPFNVISFAVKLTSVTALLSLNDTTYVTVPLLYIEDGEASPIVTTGAIVSVSTGFSGFIVKAFDVDS